MDIYIYILCIILYIYVIFCFTHLQGSLDFVLGRLGSILRGTKIVMPFRLVCLSSDPLRRDLVLGRL